MLQEGFLCDRADFLCIFIEVFVWHILQPDEPVVEDEDDDDVDDVDDDDDDDDKDEDDTEGECAVIMRIVMILSW